MIPTSFNTINVNKENSMKKTFIFFLYMGLILQTNQQFATETQILIAEKKDAICNLDMMPFDLCNKNQTSLPIFHQDNSLFHYFLKPITFTQKGISHYFTHTYNHEKYTEYLPYNFSHMIQFLEYGQEYKQDERYAISIIKLFLQKIKACDFVNSYSLITSMPKLANALTPYVEKKEASFLQELQDSLKKRFSHIFSNYFSYFQKNSDAFLDALSEQIAKKTHDVQTQQHIDVEHVKKDILRFLEICINKLVWSPEEAYDAWISLHELAEQSYNFLDKNLINDVDALDDLHWSLIHRFCYFLDIAHEDISQDIFIQIINDIQMQDFILFKIEEQETLILSKKDYVLRKITTLQHLSRRNIQLSPKNESLIPQFDSQEFTEQMNSKIITAQ